ncbi:MAG: transposase [Caldilineaceae bacterium]|nr:transposase [Caldilineaceae bacterium]
MIQEARVDAQALRDLVVDVAKAHFSLAVHGYWCETAMIYDVLLKAASERISIEAACADLTTVADSNTVREHLNRHFQTERLRTAEAEMNQALAAHLPDQLLTHTVAVAIDYHDEPCYGKTAALRTSCCQGKAKAGTTHFVRIASAYVIYRQLRLTLAVTYVLPEDDTVEVVARLLHRLQTLNLRLRVLYLDKGFCSGTVIRYLQAHHVPAVLACAIRGKIGGKAQGGTRRLCRGRKSYRTAYTFTDGTPVEVAVVATLVPDKAGKLRRKWLLFVVLALDWSPKTVYRRYRFRFGIECSYRMLRQMRIRSTSRNPALRFFLLGFALLLLNLWAVVRWVVSRIPGVGPYRIDPAHFRLQCFVALLRRAIECTRGCLMSIQAVSPVKSVIY